MAGIVREWMFFDFRGIGITKQRGLIKIGEYMGGRYGEKRFEQRICTIYWDGLTLETPHFPGIDPPEWG
jgi:hypothetical protein